MQQHTHTEGMDPRDRRPAVSVFGIDSHILSFSPLLIPHHNT